MLTSMLNALVTPKQVSVGPAAGLWTGDQIESSPDQTTTRTMSHFGDTGNKEVHNQASEDQTIIQGGPPESIRAHESPKPGLQSPGSQDARSLMSLESQTRLSSGRASWQMLDSDFSLEAGSIGMKSQTSQQEYMERASRMTAGGVLRQDDSGWGMDRENEPYHREESSTELLAPRLSKIMNEQGGLSKQSQGASGPTGQLMLEEMASREKNATYMISGSGPQDPAIGQLDELDADQNSASVDSSFEEVRLQARALQLDPPTKKGSRPHGEQQDIAHGSGGNSFENIQSQAKRSALPVLGLQGLPDVPRQQQKAIGSNANPFVSMQGQTGLQELAPAAHHETASSSSQQQNTSSTRQQQNNLSEESDNPFERLQGQARQPGVGPVAESDTATASIQKQAAGTNPFEKIATQSKQIVLGAGNRFSGQAASPTVTSAVQQVERLLRQPTDRMSGQSIGQQPLFTMSMSSTSSYQQHVQMIKHFDLEHVADIGSGSYGSVRLARWIGCDVAVKKPIMKRQRALNLDSSTSDSNETVALSRAEQQILSEVERLAQVNHVNTMRLLGVVEPTHDKGLEVVTEYYHGGSLCELIEEADKGELQLSWRDRLCILQGIAAGMTYLHKLPQPVIHGDLRSPNVLLTQRKPITRQCVKIADFGSSGILKADKSRLTLYNSQMANPCACAPEKLTQNKDSPAADVYSFAIIMWELLTFKTPFHDYEHMHWIAIANAVLSGRRPELPNDQTSHPSLLPPLGYIDLMQRCWHQEPLQRPKFSQVHKQLDVMLKSISSNAQAGVQPPNKPPAMGVVTNVRMATPPSRSLALQTDGVPLSPGPVLLTVDTPSSETDYWMVPTPGRLDTLSPGGMSEMAGSKAPIIKMADLSTASLNLAEGMQSAHIPPRLGRPAPLPAQQPCTAATRIVVFDLLQSLQNVRPMKAVVHKDGSSEFEHLDCTRPVDIEAQGLDFKSGFQIEVAISLDEDIIHGIGDDWDGHMCPVVSYHIPAQGWELRMAPHRDLKYIRVVLMATIIRGGHEWVSADIPITSQQNLREWYFVKAQVMQANNYEKARFFMSVSIKSLSSDQDPVVGQKVVDDPLGLSTAANGLVPVVAKGVVLALGYNQSWRYRAAPCFIKSLVLSSIV